MFNCNRDKFSKYLIFLIFCQKDEYTVWDTIFPFLSKYFQEILNTDEMLICAGYNGYRLGLPILSEMERCIRQSAVVIYLHNTSSSECKRCRREFEMASEKDKPIAAIVEADVDSRLIIPLLVMAMEKAPKLSITDMTNIHRINKFCKLVLDLAVCEFKL